jgi:hypothetical protein
VGAVGQREKTVAVADNALAALALVPFFLHVLLLSLLSLFFVLLLFVYLKKRISALAENDLSRAAFHVFPRRQVFEQGDAVLLLALRPFVFSRFDLEVHVLALSRQHSAEVESHGCSAPASPRRSHLASCYPGLDSLFLSHPANRVPKSAFF